MPSAGNIAPSVGSCPGQSVNLPNSSNSQWEDLGTDGSNGCTMARSFDGSSIWEERCGVGISYDASNGAPLPINFLYFDIKILKNSSIQLTWELNSNVNVKNIIIERSIDGIEFKEIKIFNYNITYFNDYYDELSYIFYRIKVIDNNGLENYSDIKFIINNNINLCEDCDIFDISGKKINNKFIDLPSGIYLIKKGNNYYKVYHD